MKRFILSMIIFSQTVAAQGEKYFLSSYDLLDVDNGYRIIDMPGGGYIVAGDALDHDSNMWNFQVLYLNEWGEVLHSCGHYNGTNHTAFRDIIKTDSGYFIGGFVTDEITNGVRHPYFATLGYECDFPHYETRGNMDYNGNIFACAPTHDGGYIMGGTIYPYDTTPNYMELYLIRLDSLYNELWDTVYYDLPYGGNSYVNDMVANSDGSFHLLATVEDFYSDPPGAVLLLHIDPAGNILQQQYFDLGQDEEAANLIRTRDGGLAFTAVSDITTLHQRVTHLYKLHPNLATDWSQTYSHIRAESLMELSTGGFALSANHANAGMTHLNACIARCDTAGNLLWQRSYGDAYHEYAYDMIFEANDPTGRSGYVICGRKDLGYGGYANVYFLKLNCMGLTTLPQAAFAWQPDPVQLQPPLARFANQSQNVFAGGPDGGHYLWDFGDGSPPLGVAYDTAAVQHQYAANGIYEVALTAIVCNDTSTVRQAVCLGDFPLHQGAGFSVETDGLSASFEADGIPQYAQLLWGFGDGQTSGETSPVHEYAQPGVYGASLTLTRCGDTLSVRRDVVVEVVGIGRTENTETMPTFTPNVVKDVAHLNYNFGNEGSAKLAIYDLTGKPMATATLSGIGSYELQAANWGQGVYFYTIVRNGKATCKGKFAVIR